MKNYVLCVSKNGEKILTKSGTIFLITILERQFVESQKYIIFFPFDICDVVKKFTTYVQRYTFFFLFFKSRFGPTVSLGFPRERGSIIYQSTSPLFPAVSAGFLYSFDPHVCVSLSFLSTISLSFS
jgi:hypothetical protein